MERRVIAHVDLDAFYASVEMLRRPELAGKPVIVSGSSPRAVVTTANYEARRYGVGSAMPTSRALRLCPQAVLVPPDFTAYRSASTEVMAVLREHVKSVEVVGMDEAYLDLTPLPRPKPAMRELQAAVTAKTGLTCSIGIGPNRLVAKVCSSVAKPAGLLAMSSKQACEHFAGGPATVVPGIGPRTSERLKELGITTLADLQQTDEARLAERFGANSARFLKRRAHFQDDTPLHAPRTSESRSAETTFDTDLTEINDMLATIRDLSERLCRGLQEKDKRGRSIGVKIRLADFTTVTRARSVTSATNDPNVVADVACALLRAYAPAQPVRLLGVRIASFGDPPTAAKTRPAVQQLQLAV